MGTAGGVSKAGEIDTTVATAGRDVPPRPEALALTEQVTVRTPLTLGSLYHFPADADGTGQVIGIIEFENDKGSGFSQLELDQNFALLGVPSPTIEVVPIAGGTNTPGTDPTDPDCTDARWWRTF